MVAKVSGRLDCGWGGERKTKFFYLTTMIRRNRKIISRLIVNVNWC